MKVINPQKAKLKVIKKEQNRGTKSSVETKDKKPKRNRQNKSTQYTYKLGVCKICRRFKTGKHVHKLGKTAKGRNANKTQDMHKIRKYMTAGLLSAFNFVLPSCISYME